MQKQEKKQHKSMKNKSIALFVSLIVVNIVCSLIGGIFGIFDHSNVIEKDANAICVKTGKESNNDLIFTQTVIFANASTENDSLSKQYYSLKCYHLIHKLYTLMIYCIAQKLVEQ